MRGNRGDELKGFPIATRNGGIDWLEGLEGSLQGASLSLGHGGQLLVLEDQLGLVFVNNRVFVQDG